MALAIGFFNGYLVTRTKLPSFIITLGTFLMLQGLNLGVTKLITDTVQVSGIDEVPGYGVAHGVFASDVHHRRAQFQVAILWWIAVHHRRDVGAAADPVRQLDLRGRRRRRTRRATSASRPAGPRSRCS